jgi:hypothetical protein
MAELLAVILYTVEPSYVGVGPSCIDANAQERAARHLPDESYGSSENGSRKQTSEWTAEGKRELVNCANIGVQPEGGSFGYKKSFH